MLYPQQLSHGNVLTFTPPGFKHTLNVKFPDCRLAVCEKCKRNYKTRDMCRVRNSHTTEPWTTAYMCFTLDDNCTDANGKFIDKPLTVRMIQWQPYCVRRRSIPRLLSALPARRQDRTAPSVVSATSIDNFLGAQSTFYSVLRTRLIHATRVALKVSHFPTAIRMETPASLKWRERLRMT
jgi:hypothetical protein